MSTLRRHGHRVAVWLTVVCFAVTSCGSANPLGGASTNVNSIVVGSAGFPESKILAEIYAQTLQTNGFNVGREMGIGSRETYVPALKDHSIDLVPEYVGNLLSYFEPRAMVTMLDDIELELYKRLPGDLSILTPSPACDTDTVTVTAATAARWNLKTIGDLAPHSPEVKFAAPSDFLARPSGLSGLRQRYGLDIAPGNFLALAQPGPDGQLVRITPGGFDDASQMGVACLGDASALFSLPPGVLAGNRAALTHQLRCRIEARDLAQLSHNRHRRNLRNAAQSL